MIEGYRGMYDTDIIKTAILAFVVIILLSIQTIRAEFWQGKFLDISTQCTDLDFIGKGGD